MQAKKATATAQMRDMGIPSLSSFLGGLKTQWRKVRGGISRSNSHVDDPVTVDDAATFHDKEIEDIDPQVYLQIFCPKKKS